MQLRIRSHMHKASDERMGVGWGGVGGNSGRGLDLRGSGAEIKGL